MIDIIKDKELIWDTEKYDVILVGTSIFCMLTGGFQSKMRFKYPDLEPTNDKTPYGDRRKIGKRLTIDNIPDRPIISLLYICYYPSKIKEYIDYDGLKNCLETANIEFKGKKVASTLLGSSEFDGNGNKEKCLQIIKECCTDIDLTVYDYPQISRRAEEIRVKKYLSRMKMENPDKYDSIKNMTKEWYKKMYLA